MTFTIKVSTPLNQASDASAALVSTVLFHRCFGTIKPATNEFCGVTYPVAVHTETEQLVTQARKDVSKLMLSEPTRIFLNIDFFERKSKKSSWFAKQQDPVWESWKLELNIVKADSDRKSQTTALREAIMNISMKADSNKTQVPPITSTDVVPFPVTIDVHI
ncbi:hypothetical protein DASB73_037760 [Starmerella bacillaris]|uniref:Autophagy-related protein 101 n=1 Tax=Starmerella bacillaris TaxID=1247836 RepID=A0AAV5RQ10_STABA|nr:hypothetical protein DASB73_037760 [Starmerella bacillaris]